MTQGSAIVLALLVLGLALAPVAAAAALSSTHMDAPYCGPYAGVRCTPNGSQFCNVYVRTPRICV